jgi:hypothetical protein
MALVNFSNLDFDQVKTSIKDYLRSNSNFTDYDFEGSNLSQIIDVLAYNTYISSYNANMVANEVFIDSATLRENVVSLARNIGYLPRSRTAAAARINFTVDTTLSAGTLDARTVTLKKGTVCTSAQSFDSESYTFCVLNDITVPVVNGVASFFDIPIYEGTFITQEFIVNPFEPNPPQRYILDNPNIDYNTINVTVKGGAGDLFEFQYTFSDNLFSIDSDSRVFFLQEVPDQKYELIFGDGVFGKSLEAGNIIDVYYLVTNGPAANRISSFTFNGTLIFDSIDSNIITNGISLISANEPSFGGKDLEDVNSIRKYAPQNYSTQNRAVTTNDYIALIPKIFPEVESLSVYGGEDLDPPRFGSVFIAVKPKNRNFLSNSARDLLKQRLKRFTVAGIRSEIVDLKYLYIEIDARVYYNTSISSRPQDISTEIVRNLTSYAKSSELNGYGSRFKYSKVLKIIDNSSQAITSNITSVRIRRDLRAELNTFAEYEICFGNKFHIRNQSGYNIRSSGFKIANSFETVYLGDTPNEDMKTGSIFLFTIGSDGSPQRVKSAAGTIDYEKGEILLNPLNITDTSVVRGENLIEISAIPESNDVIGLNDLYLQLDPDQIKVTLFEDRISSGSDTSGTQYIVNSSYQEEDLIRR